MNILLGLCSLLIFATLLVRAAFVIHRYRKDKRREEVRQQRLDEWVTRHNKDL